MGWELPCSSFPSSFFRLPRKVPWVQTLFFRFLPSADPVINHYFPCSFPPIFFLPTYFVYAALFVLSILHFWPPSPLFLPTTQLCAECTVCPPVKLAPVMTLQEVLNFDRFETVAGPGFMISHMLYHVSLAVINFEISLVYKPSFGLVLFTIAITVQTQRRPLVSCKKRKDRTLVP